MKKLPPRPTLADVARVAGVSPATVSRVVDRSGKVAPNTRALVLTAMEQLGYYGNAAARQLVSGEAGAIGIITSNTADYGYAATIQGIARSAYDYDRLTLISLIEGHDGPSVQKAVSLVASQSLSGIIVIHFDALAHAVLPALPRYLPIISATSGQSPGAVGSHRSHAAVKLDEYVGGQLAAKHLIQLGHRTVFIIAPFDTIPHERRSAAVLDALSDAGLPHYPLVRCADWGPSSGYKAAKQILDRYGSHVTALVAANDEVALGAIKAITEQGLRVPEDISVVGFDDSPAARFINPSLTTVRQDFTRLGEAAFHQLRAILEDQPVAEDDDIRPVLVVRGSTARANPARGLR